MAGFGGYHENGKMSGRGKQNIIGAMLIISFGLYFELGRYLPVPYTVTMSITKDIHNFAALSSLAKSLAKGQNILGTMDERSSCPHWQVSVALRLQRFIILHYDSISDDFSLAGYRLSGRYS